MSRIGRAPITVPAGVDVTIGAENEITVKGPLGTLTHKFPAALTFTKEDGVMTKRKTVHCTEPPVLSSTT